MQNAVRKRNSDAVDNDSTPTKKRKVTDDEEESNEGSGSGSACDTPFVGDSQFDETPEASDCEELEPEGVEPGAEEIPSEGTPDSVKEKPKQKDGKAKAKEKSGQKEPKQKRQGKNAKEANKGGAKNNGVRDAGAGHLRLPPGWLDCPPLGQNVEKIFPAKVPLGPAYAPFIPEEKIFTPDTAVDMIARRGWRLGLVIDLTNSFRYYDPEDWDRRGIYYVKIPCRGRGETPDPFSVNRFVYVVNKFCEESPDNKSAILVHCTHGFNRTGFMICHTMLRLVPHMTMDYALRSFAGRRPPGIYKDDYINDLFHYAHETRSQSLLTPPVPDWKGVDDGDDEDDDGSGRIAKKPEDAGSTTKKKIEHDDIIGEEIGHDEQQDLRAKIISMMMGEEHNYSVNRFPGSQPVSLDRTNLRLLNERRYWVTWKADGTRYLLLLMPEGVYLIDRSFKFRRLQMRFPHSYDTKIKLTPNTAKLHHGTLLDGEMVVDNDTEQGTYTRRFLAYDLILLAGRNMMNAPFMERFKLIQPIFKLRTREEMDIAKGLCKFRYNYRDEPFRVRIKGFWPLSKAPKIFDMMKELTHECDGLILQACEDRYIVGTCHELLKWKFAHLNSVDFRMRINNRGEKDLFLLERGRDVPLKGAEVEFPDGTDPNRFDNKIIECSYNGEKNTWFFLRERIDKSTPNAFHVYKKVVKSIQDDISKDELLEHMQKAYQEAEFYMSDRAQFR